jgi:hypothetical protein
MSASGHEEIRCQKIVVRQFGGIEVLEVAEGRLSAPPPGHARLKVLAIGVGFTDLMARAGDYILQRTVPFTPGYELVGEVIDYRSDGSGQDPEWVTPGTRVAVTLPKMGAYSGSVVLPSWLLVPVPDGLDANVAATIPLDYLTAVSVLERHGRVAAVFRPCSTTSGERICVRDTGYSRVVSAESAATARHGTRRRHSGRSRRGVSAGRGSRGARRARTQGDHRQGCPHHELADDLTPWTGAGVT